VKHFLVVGAGGFIGAGLRYGINQFANKIFSVQAIPYGTLFVNCIGCLFIGYILEMTHQKHTISDELMLFIVVGFLGGLTTFSAFGKESFELIIAGNFLSLLLNIGLNIILSLTAVWLGVQLVR